MAAEESKDLKKYFENDPPSFFDDLSVKEDLQRISSEVRDIWPQPEKVENLATTGPCVTTESLSDPIAQAIQTVTVPSELDKRKQANLDSLTVDDRGIKMLIDDKCYRGAIALTSRLLTNYGQGFGQRGNTSVKHTIHSLQLWHTRLALLLKINEMEIVKREAESFGQLANADFFYEHQHPQQFKSKFGSMASFSFRLLLAAEIPLKLNRPVDALSNLLKILEITQKVYDFFNALAKENEAEFWQNRKIRVISLMINCAMQIKNFDLVHQLFNEVLSLPNLSEDTKFSFSSAWGRTYLLCGDIPSAEAKFKIHEPKKVSQKVQMMIDKGLVAVAQNDYEDAYKQFESAHEIDKDNILILNNMAVCHLYTGKMHLAIQLYEKAINLNPRKSINEALLLNCSTLYELESNESKKKKIDLLKLVSANRADLEMSIEACLKL